MFSEINSLSFKKSLGSDNHSGVHPAVMEALLAANQGHAHSYGMDPLSELTQQEFSRVFGPTGFVQYVFNGSAANVISLAGALKRFEAVFCSEQAHMNLDECGAPENIAHTKLIALPSQDGKIHPGQTKTFLQRRGDQHHVQPRLVSLTQPTELGVCYTLEELKKWKNWCDHNQFYLHCDGARLANSCVTQNISLQEYGEIFDFISFGGTKNGLLGAEAIVGFHSKWAQDFKFTRKQLLHLPSKTRFLAAQFYAYLKNDLYLDVARQVCEQAQYLASELADIKEISLAFPVESNALFVQIPKKWIKPLREQFFFYIWDPDQNLVRLMISHDWTRSDSDQFIHALKEVKQNVQLS